MSKDPILEKEPYLEPETIRALRGDDLSSLEVQKELVEKLIKTGDAAFNDFYVFENVIQVLNDVEPNLESLDGCSPEHIWFALSLMKEWRPGIEELLSYEVKQYIRFCFKEEGIIFYPAGVGMPSPYLDKVIDLTNKINGPIIEDAENPLARQAIHYLRLIEYTKNKMERI